MKVFVLGAYGLIGTEVVRALVDAGHEVTGLGRDVAAAERRFPHVSFISADLSRLTRAQDWQPLIERFAPDAIVNAAGALQDGARDDVARVQSAAIAALIAAAAAKGAVRFVQISAVRSARDAETAFMRSKGEADAALAASGLDWVILRPGLVFGAQGYGGTALLRAIAAVPYAQPLVHADRIVRTVAVEDVATAVIRVLAGDVATRATYDLVEDDGQPLADVVRRLRAWLGFPVANIVTVPLWAARLASGCADALGWLGWRSPFRSTSLTELAAGIDGDPMPWRQATGRSLQSFKETLARRPSTVQERWFARAFLLKPLIIATLALVFVATGSITLLVPDAAIAVLTDRGIGPTLASLAAIGGAVLDILLGFAVMVRATMPSAARGMIVLTGIYVIAGTVLAPDLWADPLGPLVKAVPIIVLALAALAVAEDR